MNNLPLDLAKRIGAVAKLTGTDAEPRPQTMLDWALSWARHKLKLFPCESYLGVPLVENWYKAATSETAALVEWWSLTPDADIAAVPSLSGHFVICAIAEHGGLDSLDELERQYGALMPEFTTENRWGNLHLWFKGEALSSRNLLGPGLHVRGAGTFVYMPASLAPDAE